MKPRRRRPRIRWTRGRPPLRPRARLVERESHQAELLSPAQHQKGCAATNVAHQAPRWGACG
eukprot:10298954-Lingulodinium_polyedra.AAC.1